MEESVHLRNLDLSTRHPCAVITTFEHSSASVLRGQNSVSELFVNERLVVCECVGSVLLIEKIVVVQVIGGLAGVKVTCA